MKLKTVFQAVNWVNLGTLVLSVLNQWGDLFPGVDVPPWVLKFQILLGILMPSLAGITHRLSFNEAQTPADRTIAEVASAATQVKATMVAATTEGVHVEVPTIKTVAASGTKPVPETP